MLAQHLAAEDFWLAAVVVIPRSDQEEDGVSRRLPHQLFQQLAGVVVQPMPILQLDDQGLDQRLGQDEVDDGRQGILIAPLGIELLPERVFIHQAEQSRQHRFGARQLAAYRACPLLPVGCQLVKQRLVARLEVFRILFRGALGMLLEIVAQEIDEGVEGLAQNLVGLANMPVGFLLPAQDVFQFVSQPALADARFAIDEGDAWRQPVEDGLGKLQ